MSWQATTWAQRQNTGSPSRKLVLLVLSNFADERGYCWPSQQRIARDTEQSVDTVQRCLRKLEELRLLRKAKLRRKRGLWPICAYQLLMDDAAGPQTADCGPVENPSGPSIRAARKSTRAAIITPAVPQALRHQPSENLQTKYPVRPASVDNRPKHSDRFPDQGKYEVELAELLGEDGHEILGSLTSGELREVCQMQRDGQIGQAEVFGLHCHYNGVLARRAGR